MSVDCSETLSVCISIGAFMLIAWTSTVSAGVIMARYFKPDWPERNILGQKVWFQVGACLIQWGFHSFFSNVNQGFLFPQLHRMLMALTVLLTLVGFVLPFMYRGGWSKVTHTHTHTYKCLPVSNTHALTVCHIFIPFITHLWLFNNTANVSDPHAVCSE